MEQQKKQAKHTPEPWLRKKTKDGFGLSIYEAGETPGTIRPIADTFAIGNDPEVWDRALANAARIVDCVNALAGIDDPATYVAKVNALREEVATCGVFLSRCVDGPTIPTDDDLRGMRDTLRAALAALAEGGAS